jgi:hypothetical protein
MGLIDQEPFRRFDRIRQINRFLVATSSDTVLPACETSGIPQLGMRLRPCKNVCIHKDYVSDIVLRLYSSENDKKECPRVSTKSCSALMITPRVAIAILNGMLKSDIPTLENAADVTARAYALNGTVRLYSRRFFQGQVIYLKVLRGFA